MITTGLYEVTAVVENSTPEELGYILHRLYLEAEKYKHAFHRAEALIDCYETEFGTPNCMRTEYALYEEASRSC